MSVTETTPSGGTATASEAVAVPGASVPVARRCWGQGEDGQVRTPMAPA